MAFNFFGATSAFLSSGITDLASKFGLPVGASAYAMGGAAFGTKQATIDVSRQVKYSLITNSSSGTSTFTFPISPQGLVATKQVMSHWYDLNSNSTQSNEHSGVNRLVDIYGIAPPIFSLTGHTGYNYYRTDTYQKTGTDWMRYLQNFIEDYFLEVQNANSTGAQLPTMQFTDYWYGQSWYVVPVGPVQIRQTANAPLWMYYRLDLVATEVVGGTKGVSAQQAIQQPSQTSFLGGVVQLGASLALSKALSII